MLAPATNALACGPYYYSISELYLYRVQDTIKTNERNNIYSNIDLWSTYTKHMASATDIETLVYKYALSELSIETLQKDTNTFARYLIRYNDQLAINYLRLAKQCEHWRFKQMDPWYYPTKADLDTTSLKTYLSNLPDSTQSVGVKASLRQIVAQSTPLFKSKLGVRYMLQAIRAAFSLKEYHYCIELWSKTIKLQPKSVVRDMCEEYLTGAYLNEKEYDKVLAHYATNDDLSLKNLEGAASKLNHKFDSTFFELELLDTYRPNQISSRLQKICWQAEEETNNKIFKHTITDQRTWKRHTNNDALSEKYVHLRDLALRRVAHGSKNAALWQYTAAFLTMLNNEPNKAYRMAVKAQRMPASKFLKEGVDALETMLYAMTATYDLPFEHEITKRLQRLDSYLVAEHKNGPTLIFDSLYYSCYYFKRALDKITLAVIAPRYLKEHKPEKALFLAGLASERMRELTSFRATYNSQKDENPDFHTKSFQMMNQLSAKENEQFVAVLYSGGRTPLERFCAAHCYKNRDYYNEILGTLHMREERFDKAIYYFKKLPKGYDTTLNINSGMWMNPFHEPTIRRKYIAEKMGYKLRYAQQMFDLQRMMNTAKSQDIKAELTYRYGLGLLRASTDCWKLMRYYNASDSYAPHQWLLPMHTKAIKTLESAYLHFSDKEQKALCLGVIRWGITKWDTEAQIKEQYKPLIALLPKQYSQTKYFLTLTGKRCP